MTTAWTEYLPDIRMEIPMCPEIIAVHAIRKAAIELCQLKVWQQELDLAALSAGDPLVEIDLPVDSEVSTIMDVRFYPSGEDTATKVIGPVDPQLLDSQRPGWRDEACAGTLNTVIVCTNPEPETLRVVPIPVVSQADAIGVLASLRPTRDSDEGPDFLYQDYLNTIATGALANLFGMGGQPWTNPDLAVMKMGMFDRLKRQAVIRQLRGNGAEPMQVNPRTLA